MKELLLKAKDEIVRLRRANELLQARADVVEVFAAALGGLRPRDSYMTVDVVWEIDQALTALEPHEE